MDKPLKILVVEDSPDDQLLLKEWFKDAQQYHFDFTYTAVEAVERIQKEHPDLILLDLKLEGMREDGVWLLRQLHEQNCKTPIALLTGLDGGELVEAAMHFDVVAHVKKPLTKEKMGKLSEMLFL